MHVLQIPPHSPRVGVLLICLPCRPLLPALPFYLALMRATRAAAAGGGAAPREWVCVAWGLHQLGVAFSATFTARLLQELDADRGERVTASTQPSCFFSARGWVGGWGL
jgi:hypothetical protein